MRNFLLLLIILLPSLLWGQEATYLTIRPKDGDGIISVLRRYKLLDNECDKKHFYTINKLSPKSILLTDRTYKLPILIYPYNGKSIRSSIHDNDWDKAVRIKEFNDKLFRKKVKPKRFNQRGGRLWVPYHEVYCEDDVIPEVQPVTTGKLRNFPIFGEKHAHTPLVSSALKGQVFYVVSGHGGLDPGAMGKYGKNTLCEDEYAYDVALRLCRKLIQYGGRAYMIIRDENDGIRSGKILPCDTDEKTWKTQKIFDDQKKRLKQRTLAVNKLYKLNRKSGVKQQKMISIHIDSRSKRHRADVFFYYYKESKKGHRLAKKLHQTFKKKYELYQKNRGYTGTISSRDLYVLKYSHPPSVYVELGNIKNTEDQKRFILESNREILAKWLFEGLTGLKLK